MKNTAGEDGFGAAESIGERQAGDAMGAMGFGQGVDDALLDRGEGR
jgi:hypothetical protein